MKSTQETLFLNQELNSETFKTILTETGRIHYQYNLPERGMSSFIPCSKAGNLGLSH